MSVFCCAGHVAVRFALMCCYVGNRIRGSHEVLYSFGFTATEHGCHLIPAVSLHCKLSLAPLLQSSFCLPTAFLAALRAISSMAKRPLDQGSTSRKRSTLTRPATEQTPEIPTGARSAPTRSATEQTPEISASAEATMHDPRNASILQCSDSTVEPDAATQHMGLACLVTIDDVTLISIFRHFANCFVAMPMVGTCRRIFITWTRKRRQLALEELTNLRCWLEERELENVMLFNQQNGGNVAIRSIYLPLCELEDLIK